MKRCAVGRVFGALAVAGLAALAEAQVPVGTEFKVNNDPSHLVHASPVVALDQAGAFVVVWGRHGYNSGDDVLGRRYDAAGVPQGDEFVVSASTLGDQAFPHIAMAARGDFVVAWQTRKGANSNIEVQRYAASGQPIGSNLEVAAAIGTTHGVGASSVAPDGAGGFVVAWGRVDGGAFQVQGQRYDSAGAPREATFRVDSSGAQAPGYLTDVKVAADRAGNFVVAWVSATRDTGGLVHSDVLAQRFDAQGGRRGGEFGVNENNAVVHEFPDVAMAPAGDFVVVWYTIYSNGPNGLRVRRFDAAGTPLGVEENPLPDTDSPSVAIDAAGGFVVGGDGYFANYARRFEANGVPRGPAFRVDTLGGFPILPLVVASDSVGNLVGVWGRNVTFRGPDFDVQGQRFAVLAPGALRIDTAGNGILEPGETVDVRPAWRNVNAPPLPFGGGAVFTGPPASGVSYAATDAVGDYGTPASGATAECTDCYGVSLGFAGTRPGVHWDAAFTERITPEALGQTKPWSVHVGESFSDVPGTSPFYRFVETLLHRGVTAGCGGTSYCAGAASTRAQMAVFVLAASEGARYAPTACGVPLFGDVPASSPFCRWVEELARRGVASGCGGGNYCPEQPVTREQMSVFVLRTLDPTLDPPACTTPLFADVPASSPFCRWIEELARRQVVGGCGGGNYCPQAAVTREQMAVFLVATFGLSLYGV